MAGLQAPGQTGLRLNGTYDNADVRIRRAFRRRPDGGSEMAHAIVQRSAWAPQRHDVG